MKPIRVLIDKIIDANQRQHIQTITITYEKISTQYIYNEGYNILFKVCLKSGDEIIFDSLLGVDKSNYLRGIEIMKKEGITFIDKYHIGIFEFFEVLTCFQHSGIHHTAMESCTLYRCTLCITLDFYIHLFSMRVYRMYIQCNITTIYQRIF